MKEIINLYKNNKFYEASLLIEDEIKYKENSYNLNLAGLIFYNLKNFEKSIEFLKKAILLNKKYYEAYNNLGIVLIEDKQFDVAKKILEAGIIVNDKFYALYENLGRIYEKQKQYDLAIKLYKKSLELNYNKKGVVLLANVYIDIKRYSLALLNYKKLDKFLKKKDSDVNNLIGIIFSDKNKFIISRNFFLRSIKLNKKNYESIHNLAFLYIKNYKYRLAEKLLKKSLKLNSSYADGWNTLGMLYYKQNKFILAKKYYNKAIDLNNDYLEPKYNLGILNIRLGNYKIGWKLREEYRINKNINLHKNKLWNGKNTDGTLLVLKEQGLGDQILFLQTIQLVFKKAKNILIIIDKRLMNLFSNFIKKNKISNVTIIDKPDISLQDREHLINQVDKFTLLGSLPGFSLNSINDHKKIQFPYLIPNKKALKKFNINRNKINVGISWKTTNVNEKSRIIDLKKVLKCFDKNKYNFFNLQFGNPNEIQKISKTNDLYYNNTVDYNLDIETISRLIGDLDFIVSVQNTISHLSLALNKKTYVFIPKDCRFNWGYKGSSSPFYPKAIVLRQKKFMSWESEYTLLQKMLKKKPR